jgi:hypothetical protein
MMLPASKGSEIVKTTILAWVLLVTSGFLAGTQEFGRSAWRRSDDLPNLPRSHTGSKTHVRYSINTDHMENDGEEVMTMLRELQDQIDSFGPPPSDMPSDIPSMIPVPTDYPFFVASAAAATETAFILVCLLATTIFLEQSFF